MEGKEWELEWERERNKKEFERLAESHQDKVGIFLRGNLSSLQGHGKDKVSETWFRVDGCSVTRLGDFLKLLMAKIVFQKYPKCLVFFMYLENITYK